MTAWLPGRAPCRPFLAPFLLTLSAALVPSFSAAADGPVYRTITRTYDTSSYYTRGLLKKEVLQDTQGNPFTETENTYTVVPVADGAALAGLEDFSETRFPQLTRTDRRFYEGQLSPGKTTFTENQYDDLGNIIRFADAGDLGATDDVLALLQYTNCGPSYISKANRIEVVLSACPPSACELGRSCFSRSSDSK